MPLILTIPLAIYLKSYWALIIGTIGINFINSLILYGSVTWKPRIMFDKKIFYLMASYSIWVFIDSILVWLTSYIDIFIIGTAFNEFLLGIYKTSISLVGQITTLIAAIILPVLYPALSRLQNNTEKLKKTLLKFQKNASIILLPLGFGIFIFSDLIVDIMLGEKWKDAYEFLGFGD